MSKSPLMVSVSGIRGVIGDSLVPEVMLRYTAAYASWCRSRGAAPGAMVAVGRDGRPSGLMVLDLIKGTLAAAGFGSIDLGVCTTPGTAMAVPHLGAVGGIVITASHNPAPWNALKFLDGDGNFISAEMGRELIAIAEQGDFDWRPHDELGGFRRWQGADAHHIDAILALPGIDRDRIAAAGFKVVVDAVNASGSKVLPQLLTELGAEAVPLHCDGSGEFPHNPEPRPEHLVGLSAAVLEQEAQLGLALDPDSDRLVLVDEGGAVLSEEYTLALAADYWLSLEPGPVAANLSTSRMIDDVAARYGQVCHRSAVGEAHVVAIMKEQGAVIGGEGNGGVILPALHAGRDGLVGAALIMSSIATSGRPLSLLASELPSYVMEKRRVKLSERGDPELVRRLASEYFSGELDLRDGVKAVCNEGWLHVRPSNTEAILRIIGESADSAWLTDSLDAAERFFAEQLG